jgi:hypothetical protein
MGGQDRETAGKRKTKNFTSLVEEEKDLAKAKKESEKQIRQEQKLKKKEDEDLKMALAVSKLQVSNDKSLAISERKAERKEEGDHLISVQTIQPPHLNPPNFICWALLRCPQHVLAPQPHSSPAYLKEKMRVILMIKFWAVTISLPSRHLTMIKNTNLVIHSRSYTTLMARLMSPLLMKLWTLPWKDLPSNKIHLKFLKHRSKSILGNWKHNSISIKQWQSSKRKILTI